LKGALSVFESACRGRGFFFQNCCGIWFLLLSVCLLKATKAGVEL
jgi:hypothetical protein